MASMHHAPEVIAFVTAGVTAVELVAPSDNFIERLGTAGILVVASIFMLRWMMAQLEKKDKRIEEITAVAVLAAEKNSLVLMDIVKEDWKVKREVADAMREFTNAVNQVRQK